MMLLFSYLESESLFGTHECIIQSLFAFSVLQ